MKKYYRTLTKEKKKKIQEQYKQKYKGTDLDKRLNRLLIYSISGYVGAIIIIIEAFITPKEKISNLAIAISLVLASTTFLIGRTKIKIDVLNKLTLKIKNG